MALVIALGIGCDLLVLSITRNLLRRMRDARKLSSLSAYLAINCLLSVALLFEFASFLFKYVAVPSLIGRYLFYNRFFIGLADNSFWFSLFAYAGGTNFLAILLTGSIMFIMVIAVANYVFWPTVERCLLVLTRDLATMRRLLRVVGLLLVGCSFPQTTAVIDSLLKRLG
jgi:hypothetical protein